MALLLLNVADAMSLALSQNQKAETKLQMLLISQKRLPEVLEMAIQFSKEKYYMGRSFACLKLPDLKQKKTKNNKSPN